MTLQTRSGAAGLVLALVAGMAGAETQPYAGQQDRAIASLSPDDIAALEAGDGWGLAKPAELNGYPGPAHLLELAGALDLTETQRAQVEAIRAHMTAEAQAAGRAYIDAEAHMSRMFASGHAAPGRLDSLLGESAAALARLRYVHLRAHLEVTPLLTDDQKERYAELRGYADQGEPGGHTGHGNH